MTERRDATIFNPSGVKLRIVQGPNGPEKPKADAAVGVSAASARTLGARLISFYFRAPVKAFFRTRVE